MSALIDLRMRKKIVLIAVVAGMLMLIAPAAAQNSVDGQQQVTEGDEVVIDSLEIDEGGWVAVYGESASGNLGTLYGAESVSEGSHSRVGVNTSGLDESGFVVAALHYDEVPGEFDPDGDPLVEENGTAIQDTFFVAVRNENIDVEGSPYIAYADAKQQRRDYQNQIEDLQSRLDDLEDEEGNFTDEINNIQDDISSLEEDADELDDQISETEDLLQQIEQNQPDSDDDSTEDGGNETDSGGNETDEGSEDGSDDGGEGLPGFTVVGTVLALLTGGAIIRRSQE